MKWWKPSPDSVPEMAWYESLVAVSRRARAAQIIWPVFIDDFEFFGRFDMPLVVFLARLIGGELDARFLSDETVPMRLDPTKIKFVQRPMRPQ